MSMAEAQGLMVVPEQVETVHAGDQVLPEGQVKSVVLESHKARDRRRRPWQLR